MDLLAESSVEKKGSTEEEDLEVDMMDNVAEGTNVDENGDGVAEGDDDCNTREVSMGKEPVIEMEEPAELSININAADIDMYVSDSDESYSEAASGNMDHTHEDDGDNLVEQRSKLHCMICGNLYTDPRLLECLHTFCLECIQSLKKNKKRYPHCPVCEMAILNRQLKHLPKNLVLNNLLSSDASSAANKCIVCSLHDIEAAPTGRCMDCGDLLCESCCEKHTFSRQTAKHKIVPINSDSPVPQRSLYKLCPSHDEMCSNFCLKCKTAVCKDCVQSDHSEHKYMSIEAKNKEIQHGMDAHLKELEQMVSTLEDNDNYNEVLEMLGEKEKKEIEILTKGKEKCIEHIEKEHEKHMKILAVHFSNIKNRTKRRHSYIQAQRRDVSCLRDNIDFILSEGQVDEIMQMHGIIEQRINKVNSNCKKTYKPVTTSSNLPRAYFRSDFLNTMKAKSIFYVSNPDKLAEKSSSEPVRKQPDHLPSTSRINQAPSQEVRFPARGGGRGALLQRHLTPSLLGDYPGPQGAASRPGMTTRQPETCFTNGKTSSSVKHSWGQAALHNLERTNYADSMQMNILPDTHKTPLILKQRSSVNVRLESDKKVPDIVGLVFTSLENFVVCDARNQLLKAFSCWGKFIDCIPDQGPNYVTFCKNYLIWNSQFSSIKFYDTKSCQVRTNTNFTPAPHPLTTCRDQTYLVANVHHSSIEAYTVEAPGKLVLFMEPRDRDGQIIQNVGAIAARSKNQLVILDAGNKRIVVNDLTGIFLGEFWRDGMHPSAICITEHDQILVTDAARDKIILLSARGDFIKEWPTLVEQPCAVATNGNGTLVVAGAGRDVKIYEYKLAH
ncbi:TRI56-like protein [Mya arenaria]|uniref:TRI56-like protein n=1 Tax=Mya arenaria TaxID=6604 RepID=A0ABY7FKV8_MYAAR|nr:E3 ubiquitin-protein ligase TRIM56-like [Mya arenaria]WAR22835.1 TRI56-like protein [Mya arenaria]